MIQGSRPFFVASVATLAAAVVVGCADDGNDGAYQMRRAAALAEEQRTTTSVLADGADAGPASSEAPSPTAPSVEPTGVVVPVFALDNSFRPELVEISIGDEVLWENRGMNEHNVLRVEGDDWGVEVEAFQPGDVYSHLFTEPGEYRYYCSIHGSTDVGMVGTIVVTG